LPPEPAADAAASELDAAPPARAGAAVQDARLPFEAYAATHFSTSAAATTKPKKSFGCFGFCFSSDARGSSAYAEDPSASASHSSSPIGGALTAAAEALGASGVSAALFRAMLDHAGDDSRVSLTKGSRSDAAKQTAPSSLFFTRRGGTAPRNTEVTRALDALAFDDDAGAAMRDEWYCQFLKQTSNHPSAKRELRLWRLAYLAACAFAPSDKLAPYVLARCRDAAEGTAGSDEVAFVAELTRVRLVAARTQGASCGLLSDETRARAADRDFLVAGIPRVPAFGATLEELAIVESKERALKATRSPTFNNAREEREEHTSSDFSFTRTNDDDANDKKTPIRYRYVADVFSVFRAARVVSAAAEPGAKRREKNARFVPGRPGGEGGGGGGGARRVARGGCRGGGARRDARGRR
jgi:hypothetical protein